MTETPNEPEQKNGLDSARVDAVVMRSVDVVWAETPFALLAGATYYPARGWQDIVSLHSTIDAAEVEGKKKAGEYYGWYQVLDLRDLKIVAGYGAGHTGLFGLVSAGGA